MKRTPNSAEAIPSKEEDLKLDSTYTVDIAFHCGEVEHVIGGGIVPKVLLLLIVSKAT